MTQPVEVSQSKFTVFCLSAEEDSIINIQILSSHILQQSTTHRVLWTQEASPYYCQDIV